MTWVSPEAAETSFPGRGGLATAVAGNEKVAVFFHEFSKKAESFSYDFCITILNQPIMLGWAFLAEYYLSDPILYPKCYLNFNF